VGLNGFFIIARAAAPLYTLPSIQLMSTESGEDYVYPASWMGLRADGEWQQLQTSQGHSLELRDLVAETVPPRCRFRSWRAPSAASRLERLLEPSGGAI
jgi:hypothetical protein